MLFTFDNKRNGSLNRNNLSHLHLCCSTTDETPRYYSQSFYISMILFSNKQQSIDNYN